MKFVSRTWTVLACATSLVFALPAMAVEKVNIGVVTGPTFVHTISAQKFKEEVDKALPGKYDVVVHHSGALGSETQVLQQLQLGTVQMAVTTTGPIEAFVNGLNAVSGSTPDSNAIAHQISISPFLTFASKCFFHVDATRSSPDCSVLKSIAAKSSIAVLPP